jgi:hypothetical protein
MAYQVPGDEFGRFFRQEHVAGNLVHHLDRDLLEALAANQHEDRQFQTPRAHQCDQRGGLALHTALAPIDHHAADRGVGADSKFRLLRAARPQHLEAKLLHRACDLLQSRTFERSGGKCRRAE